MKTLKQYSKKLSQYIFESVGDIRGYPDLDVVTMENVKEWLTQKRQEKEDLKKGFSDTQAHHIIVMTNLIDELLEELNQ